MFRIIAIIDAEIAENPGRLRRYPNLACMKLSGYHKRQGDSVILKTDYKDLEAYEKVYVSKVFTKTKYDEKILCLPNVKYGGTGFFYGEAPYLPHEIERGFPDYSLYDEYVRAQLEKGAKPTALCCFTDYSIGFLTRGCFRKCQFCVSQRYDRCVLHSPLEEFYDSGRKKIMLLDDNILAHPDWRRLIEGLCETGKPFCFKQGVDIRLITPEFISLINSARYDRELFFAFDDIADRKMIERKLAMFREHSNKGVKIYLLCGYDRNNKYDTEFWLNDIAGIFIRLAIIGKYQVMPYLMRHEKFLDSPYAGLYKAIGTYCNFGGLFKVISFRQFCLNQLESSKNKEKPCSRWRYYAEFLRQHPHFETRFFAEKYWVKAR